MKLWHYKTFLTNALFYYMSMLISFFRWDAQTDTKMCFIYWSHDITVAASYKVKLFVSEISLRLLRRSLQSS